MKLYTAGAFDHQLDIDGWALLLERAGHEITSNWLNEPPLDHSDPERHRWEKRARAHEDIFDIKRADGIVVFTEWPSTSGGFDCEFMLAWGEGLELYVVGPLPNVFFYLSEVQQFDSVENLITHLADR